MTDPYVELHARSAFSFLQGASAPEDLVQSIIHILQERYDATVEDAHVTEEDMHFELPYSLRRLEQDHAVQLTVGGK